MKKLILAVALMLPMAAQAVTFTITDDVNPAGTTYNIYCNGTMVNAAPITGKTFTVRMEPLTNYDCVATAVLGEMESDDSLPVSFLQPASPSVNASKRRN